MITTQEMWKWRYKDNVKIINTEGKEYVGDVAEILDEEEAFGEDLLVLIINKKGMKQFSAKDIVSISNA